MIHGDLTTTVGGTPMVELGRLASGLPGRVVAKLEMRNPCGSVKDRVGVAMIEDAERRGVLRPGMTLVEATGGNTGIGLAFAAATRGYRLILTMPETMSTERVALLKHLGAEVVLTPGILMGDAVARAEEIQRSTPASLMLDQFRNPSNPDVHRRTTAVEIWKDTQGAVDIFVSAVGTGARSPVSATASSDANRRCAPLPSSRQAPRCYQAGPRAVISFPASGSALSRTSLTAHSSMRSLP
jgi:cysteine synthase A